MNNPNKYIQLSPHSFPEGSFLLPVPIYQKEKDQYIAITQPNIPFTFDFLKKENRNFFLMDIHQNTFFSFFKINPWIFPEYQGSQSEDKENRTLHFFKFEFDLAAEKNNFDNFAQLTRDNILHYLKDDESEIISLAKNFTNKLLTHGSENNIVVSLSYYFARLSKIDSSQAIAELILASFLHHIGITQVPTHLLANPYLYQNKKEKKEYQKHPYYALHLIKKGHLHINENILNIITDHHERANGKGFPHEKKENKIHQLSFILGFSSHVVEFSSGRVNGKKYNLKNVIKMIKSRNVTDGLEIEFGSIMKEALKGFT